MKQNCRNCWWICCHVDWTEWLLHCSLIWQVITQSLDIDMLGERFIEPFPRGFKRFFGAGVGLPFPARLQLIEQQTGGRVTFRMPADAGENWYDRAGVPHHPPTPQSTSNICSACCLKSSWIHPDSLSLLTGEILSLALWSAVKYDNYNLCLHWKLPHSVKRITKSTLLLALLSL